MSLLGKGNFTDASAFAEWLDTQGYLKLESATPITTIAFAAGNIILKQRETEYIYVIDGLTEEAAELLLDYDADDTVPTVYYREITTGDFAAVTINVGGKNAVTIKQGQADDYTVIFRNTIRQCDDATGWTTTRPTATNNGIIRSQTAGKDLITYDGGVKKLNVLTTVTEYPFRTLAEANALVSANTQNTMSVTDEVNNHTKTVYAARWNFGTEQWVWSSQSTPVSTPYSYMTGTKKEAVKTYVDAVRGYTVTVTETTISAGSINLA